MKAWIPHPQGRQLIGEVPAGVEIEVYDGTGDLPPTAAEVQFWVPPFLAGRSLTGLARRLPALRVVQLLSAGVDAWAGRLPAGVTLCAGRGVHEAPTAEWVLAAVLAYLRGFPGFIRAQDRREWSYAAYAPTDELTGKRVLVVGAGSIGTAIEARLVPFEVTVTRVGRTARPNDGVHGVAELPALLPDADVVILVVPLTPQTRGLVDKDFLAAMREGALLVNAARGPVADTDALTGALATGRIHAALDVTDPEPLPPGHPLWTMPNVLITPHVGGSVRGLLPRAYRMVGEQLRRFAAGEPLRYQITGDY